MNGRMNVVRRVVVGVIAAALFAALAMPAAAQHRARLSQDLAAQLESPLFPGLRIPLRDVFRLE